MKYLLPIAGGLATAVWLASHAAAKITPSHKYGAAAVIVLACILLGALIDRARKPKPKAAPQRTGYPFAGPQRPRR